MRAYEDPVYEFKLQMRVVQKQARLSSRALAEKAHYSFGHLAAATRPCCRLPRWEVVEAFLSACDVTRPVIDGVWRPRWEKAKESEGRKKPRRPGGLSGGPGLHPNPDTVTNRADLTEQLRRLRLSAGKPSSRTIHQHTTRRYGPNSPSRSTIEDTLNGRHFPRYTSFQAIITELIIIRATADPRGPHQPNRDDLTAAIEPWIEAWKRAARSIPTRSKPKPELVLPPPGQPDETLLIRRVHHPQPHH